MPPLPSQPEEILANVRRALTDVADFQLPRLHDYRGPLDAQRDLAEEARTDLERAKANIEICRELAEGARAGQRQSLLDSCEDLENQYKRLKTRYREAVLQSKRAIWVRPTKRHDLLASSQNGESSSGGVDRLKARPETGVGEEDALQSKTNEVTDALRRTTQLMQAELERSVLSVQMLDEQTSTLRLTSTLYDTYTNLLTTSTKLVKALERADWYDRLIIGAAFLLFLLVVGWVLKRRVLDKIVGGVLGSVFWWVGGSWKLVKMGTGLGSSSAKNKLGDIAAAKGGGAGTLRVLPDTRIGKAGAEAIGKVLSSAAVVSAAAGTAVSSAVSSASTALSAAEPSDTPNPADVQDLVPLQPGASSAINAPGSVVEVVPLPAAVRDEL